MGSRALAIGSIVALGALVGCASDPRRFPLAAPVVRDRDLDAVSVPCRPDPTKDDPHHVVCAPIEYVSSFAWDAADNSVFRPIAKAFEVDTYGEAENVNAMDEVPDSSWFTNRIGVRAMTPEEAARGYCGEGPVLEGDPSDGSWTIDHGKDNGANPGFRVKKDGTKFMFKTDDEQVERATAATAIASRLYYAAGWWAPCDAVVYFKKSALSLQPGLTVKANTGPPHRFDHAMLDKVLEKTGRRGDLYRATASRWLPGISLGPFRYEGTRRDDPSDVIDHENRRDLRGARVIAAWLNHFDTREQNSMATWMQVDPKNPRSPGHVRHWYIDLGDCFGSEWSDDEFSRRHGHSYIFDVGYMIDDFFSLGAVERPWQRARRTPGQEIFGYFTSRDFEPDRWRGEYPNPAFGRLQEADGAWAARIIARFTPAHVAAAVHVGDFTNPEHERFLTDTLLQRQRILLARYFAKLSPMTDARAESPRTVCAVDLARKNGIWEQSRFRYQATTTRGRADPVVATPSVRDDGVVCIDLGPDAPPSALPDDAPERYLVVRVNNGIAPGPLVMHFYDLGGTRGPKLVGIERPKH